MNRALITLFSATVLVLSAAHGALAAEQKLNRTWRYPSAEGKQLVVDAGDMDVLVRAGDVRRVAVTAEVKIAGVTKNQAKRWIASHTPVFTDGDGRLDVSVGKNKRGFIGLGMITAKAHLTTVLPIFMVPDVTTNKGAIELWGDFPRARPLRLRTAEGKIQMTGAAASVDVRTVSGDARIEVVRPLDSFFARTASGNITLTGGARKVQVDTASGNIWLNNLSGPAKIVTSKGKVTLRWDRIDSGVPIRVRNTSGTVRIILPKGVQPSGELRTTAGKISSDLTAQISGDGKTVTFTGDGPALDVETASGRIELIQKEDGWKITPPPITEQ